MAHIFKFKFILISNVLNNKIKNSGLINIKCVHNISLKLRTIDFIKVKNKKSGEN
jgi:hypothetical protein